MSHCLDLGMLLTITAVTAFYEWLASFGELATVQTWAAGVFANIWFGQGARSCFMSLVPFGQMDRRGPTINDTRSQNQW